MKPFLLRERALTALDWSHVVGFVLGFGVVGGGLFTSLGIYQAMGTAHTAADAQAFELADYAFLTATRGTPGWPDVVERLPSAEDYYGWLWGDQSNALSAENDIVTRATFVDDYAVTYAAAVARGINLDGFMSPNDLRLAYTQSITETHSETMPVLGP